eukprot:gene12396-14500_t
MRTAVHGTCGHSSTKLDEYWLLSVPLKPTLPECLGAFNDHEQLHGENAWHCEECHAYVAAAKHVTLWSLPQYLVVHLKRFKFNPILDANEKIDDFVEFPLTGLDLAPYLAPNAPVPPELYDLYAWLHFNDSTVSHTRDLVTKNAYLLFYRRRSPGDAAPPAPPGPPPPAPAAAAAPA